MLNFIQQNAAEFIAGLAVILSAVANWRAVLAERKVSLIRQTVLRTDMLVEVELKNAAVGKLALITARKILLLHRSPSLSSYLPGEIERLESNLKLLQEFKSQENTQRHLSEQPGVGRNIDLFQQTLADTKRLRVSLEADIEKETIVYQELVEQVRADVA